MSTGTVSRLEGASRLEGSTASLQLLACGDSKEQSERAQHQNLKPNSFNTHTQLGHQASILARLDTVDSSWASECARIIYLEGYIADQIKMRAQMSSCDRAARHVTSRTLCLIKLILVD